MKPKQLFVLAVVLVAMAAFVVVVTGSSRTRGKESRAFEAIQDEAQEAKQAQEQEMEAKKEALGQPAP